MKSMFYLDWSEIAGGFIVRFSGLLHGEPVKGHHCGFFACAEHANNFIDDMNYKLKTVKDHPVAGAKFSEVFQ